MIKHAWNIVAHLACGGVLLASPAMAADDQPTMATTSDAVPSVRMVGFPPSSDALVNRTNILKPENSRWAFRNLRQLYPTRAVNRSDKARPLNAGRQIDLANTAFVTADGEHLSLAEWQLRTHTDALVVLHKGKLVYEHYDQGMTGRTPHALWSMSKSIVGLLAMAAIEEGKLDPSQPVTAYIPELQGSGWTGATLQDVLDMRVGIAYRETFSDPTADVFRYLFAAGLLAAPKDLPIAGNMYDYIKSIRAGGEHGGAFAYMSADTEVIAWILQRAYGERLSQLVSKRLWSKIGALDDAYYLVDPYGLDIGSVGLVATPLDLARLGQAVMEKQIPESSIISAISFETLHDRATRDAFARSAQASVRTGYSYRNQWWLPNDPDRTIEAKGLFGQHLVINPAKDVVIVKLSANPAGDTILTHALDKAAFAAIVKAVGNR